MENVFTKENTEGFTVEELEHLNLVFETMWALTYPEDKTADAAKNLADEILNRADKLLAVRGRN